MSGRRRPPSGDTLDSAKKPSAIMYLRIPRLLIAVLSALFAISCGSALAVYLTPSTGNFFAVGTATSHIYPFRYNRAQIIDVPNGNLLSVSDTTVQLVTNSTGDGIFEAFGPSVGETCVEATIRDIIAPEYTTEMTVVNGRLLAVQEYHDRSYGIILLFTIYTFFKFAINLGVAFFIGMNIKIYTHWSDTGFNPLRYFDMLVEAVLLVLVAAPLVGIYELQTKLILVCWHVSMIMLFMSLQHYRSTTCSRAWRVGRWGPITGIASNTLLLSSVGLAAIFCGHAYNFNVASSENGKNIVEPLYNYEANVNVRIFVLLVFILRCVYFGAWPCLTNGMINKDKDETTVRKFRWVFALEEIIYLLVSTITVIAGFASLIQYASTLSVVFPGCTA